MEDKEVLKELKRWLREDKAEEALNPGDGKWAHSRLFWKEVLDEIEKLEKIEQK